MGKRLLFIGWVGWPSIILFSQVIKSLSKVGQNLEDFINDLYWFSMLFNYDWWVSFFLYSPIYFITIGWLSRFDYTDGLVSIHVVYLDLDLLVLVECI